MDENPDVEEAHQKRLSSEKKQQVLDFLQDRCKYGKLAKGAIQEAATHFLYGRHTIGKLGKAKQTSIQANSALELRPQYNGNYGRKSTPILPESIMEIEIGRRTTYRDLGLALNMSASTIHRHMRKGELRPHSNPLKPGLTEANKRQRLMYCINHIVQDSLRVQPQFEEMENVVHIDEKWFYLTRKNLHMYVAPLEIGPHRTCKHKNHIPKLMFMSTVARPRWNSMGQSTFTGKIGIWPFSFKYAAKKNSVNRPKGTLETKPIPIINKIEFRKMMTNNVIPAIKQHWPQNANKDIIIQADNAKPHGGRDIHQFIAGHNGDGFRFKLQFQPPNSPDLNILDLGLFGSIQSKYQKKMPANIDKMIEEVHNSYEEQHPKTISNVWMSLQYCMCEIIGCKGNCNYVQPHVKKKQLEDAGNLPWQVEPNKDMVTDAISYLNEPEIARAAVITDLEEEAEEGEEPEEYQM